MPSAFECPACYEPVPADQVRAGQMVRCGTCRLPFPLSGAAPGASAAESPAPYRRKRADGRAAAGPRHRLPARAQPGRGPAFWLAAVAGASLLLVLALAGFAYHLTAAQWRVHPSNAGGFAIELPAAPKDDLLGRITNAPPGLRLEGTTLPFRREEFVVAYRDLPADHRLLDDTALLDQELDGLIRARPDAEVLERGAPLVSDLPAREVVLRSPSGGIVVARAVLAEPRLFILVAASPGPSADNPRLRRFIDSFTVTDRDLLAGARRRRERQEEVATLRRRQDESRRAVEEARAAEERRRTEAAAAKEREYQARLQRLRDEFRTAGPSAPDPDLIPGLTLHLSFDEGDRMWPRGAGTLDVRAGAAGPGARGSALYLPAAGRVTLERPVDWVAGGLTESVTVAGWVKLRFRPLTLFQVARPNGEVIGHVTVAEDQIVMDNQQHRGAQNYPGPKGSRVSASWNRDDRWHHVAAVRERTTAGERAVLYLDGRQLAEAAVVSGNWSDAGRITFAEGIDFNAKSWAGPTGPPDREGKTTWPDATEPAFAVDEICVYDRALTAAEVRRLAGVDPVPGDVVRRERPVDPTAALPAAVTLAPAGVQVFAPAGVAFDLARKTVWAVTGGAAAGLTKLSYPDLKPIGFYRLPGAAGPVAFDPVENRLFVAVQPTDSSPVPEVTGWPVARGMIHRYDLADLPTLDPTRPPAIQPAASATVPIGAPITALTVTPDGGWVLAALGYQAGQNQHARVFKLPFHLQAAEQHLTGAGLGDTAFPYRLEIPAAGPAVWFSSAHWSGEWTVIEHATDRPREPALFRLQSAERRDWAVHPDGDRGYIVTDEGGVDEARSLGRGQTGHRRRPLVAAPGARADPNAVYLGLTDDGRFLFHAATKPGAAGALTVTDTTARAGPGKVPPPSGTLNGFTGPFWVSPDGAVVVSRSGQVVRVTYPPGAAPAVRPPAARPARLTVAPPPRPALVAFRYAGRAAPAPADFPALKFHLAFDEDAGAGVKESASGKTVGKLLDGSYVDGVRGRALRLGFDPKIKNRAGRLDLTDQKGALKVGADTPFTLTVWFRHVTGWTYPLSARRRVGEQRFMVLDLNARTWPRPQVHIGLGGASSDAESQSQGWSADSRLGEWRHLALVRDGTGLVRTFVDGEEVNRFSGNGKFTDSLEFDIIGCSVPSGEEASILDIDDLCLFDQLLTDDEIRRLAAAPEVREPRPTEVRPARVAPAAVPNPLGKAGAVPRAYDGRPVPASTELKGLAFYLPGTTLVGGRTPEAVSITDMPVAASAELVDGVRGKAVRFTPKADADGRGYGMDLSGGAALKVEANRPFTLAVWVRVLDADRADNGVVLGATGAGPQPDREFVLQTGKGGVELRLGDRTAKARPGIRIAGKVPEPGRWFHLAVVRGEGGRVRLLVDGVAVESKGEPIFPHALGYDRVRLAVGPPKTTAMDLAEFLFADRALSDAEVKRLAGAR